MGILLVFDRFLLFLDGLNPPRLVFPVPFCWTQGWGVLVRPWSARVAYSVVRLTSPSAVPLGRSWRSARIIRRVTFAKDIVRGAHHVSRGIVKLAYSLNC